MPLQTSTAVTRQTIGDAELWFALDALVALQQHYATLLNHYDGGRRIAFETAEAWIERLRDMDRLEA